MNRPSLVVPNHTGSLVFLGAKFNGGTPVMAWGTAHTCAAPATAHRTYAAQSAHKASAFLDSCLRTPASVGIMIQLPSSDRP